MSDDTRDVVYAGVGVVVGASLFYKGLRDLVLERAITALPVSKVRSLALGPVELCGTAAPLTPLVDPVYGQTCAYFRVDVEERRSVGDYDHWANVYHADSDATPFLLSDETGGIPVCPEGAELYCDKLHCDESILPSQDAAVSTFLGPLRKGRPLRLNACIVREKEPVCVIGYARVSETPLTILKRALRLDLSLPAVARRLKADPAKMKAADLDKNGQVDEAEWDAALRKERDGESADDPQTEPPKAYPVVVAKNPNGYYVISDKSRRDLVASLQSQAGLYVAGGPILSVACAAYIAWRLSLARF